MNFNGRSYPYPVLGIDDNFIGDENKDIFKPELVVSSDFRKIKLDILYQLKNEELLKLIYANDAIFCTQLYCRSTMFRQSFLSSKQKDVIEIKSNQLRDEVEVDFFICALVEIKTYKNSKFNSVFDGMSFDIEKGDLLGYGGSTTFFANKTPEELKSISSFMSIDTENKTEVPMYNDYDGDKITIILSQEDYEIYQSIKKESLLTSTLHSGVVLPALAEAIRFISTTDGDEYKTRKWHELLTNLIEKHPTDDPLQSAQKILDLPVNRSFSSLYNNLIKS
jgi:hypothetical protein